MMLKLKLQYFGHLMRRADSLEKTDAGRDWGQEEKGTTEDEMAGWHHRLDGHEFEWTPEVGDGQGGPVLRFMGSQRVRHDWATELNWTELIGLKNILRWNLVKSALDKEDRSVPVYSPFFKFFLFVVSVCDVLV